jgi:hypothetical protein
MDGAAVTLSLMLTILAVLSLVVIAGMLGSIRGMLRRVLFPSGFPEIARACPHCMLQIHAQAVLCPFCKRESTPWMIREGVWWKAAEEGEQYFDPVAKEWRSPQPGGTPPTPS